MLVNATTEENMSKRFKSEEGKTVCDELLTEMTTGKPGGTILKDVVDKGPPWWRSQRYILAYILFAGMMNMFFQRINLGITIICMVNHTAIALQQARHVEVNQSVALYQNHSLTSSSLNQPYSFTQSNFSFEFSTFSKSSQLETTKGPATMYNESLRGTKTNGNELPSLDERTSCSSGYFTSEEGREDGPFLWNKQMQGLLLGALFWTYMLFQVPGNHLVRKSSKKAVTLVSMGLLTLMTLLTHVASLWSPWAVFALKLVQGGSTALAFVSMYGMWAKWAPPEERASLISFALSGQMLGNVLVFPVSGLLCKYGFLGGWPSVFYVFGLIGFVWLALFFFLAEESPATHKFITEKEKTYILSALSATHPVKQPKVPWLAILSAAPFWGIVFAHISFTWGLNLMVATLPQYMNEVLKFDIKSNGVFTMLPYIALLFAAQGAGRLSDFFIQKEIIRDSWVRKMCIIVANMVPAVLLIVMSFLDCEQTELVVALLVVGVGAKGFAFSGVMVNPYDIAPRFAVVLMTMSNTFATATGIIAPYVVATLTKNQTREQWQIVFFLTSSIYVVGTVGFCFLAEGEVQPWARVDDIETIVEIEELSCMEDGQKDTKKDVDL